MTTRMLFRVNSNNGPRAVVEVEHPADVVVGPGELPVKAGWVPAERLFDGSGTRCAAEILDLLLLSRPIDQQEWEAGMWAVDVLILDCPVSIE